MTRKATSGDGGAMPKPNDNPSKKQQKGPPKEKGEATHKAISSPQEPAPGVGHNSDMTKKALLVSTYLSHRKEEGAHHVKRCLVIVEAGAELSSDAFNAFCEEVHLPRNSSMFRKAKAVAQAAPRLLAVADRLPDAKSTLYALATVDENVFKGLFESSKRITAARVKAALPKNSEKPEQCIVSVDATSLRNGERLILLQAVKEAADKVGANVKVPKSLQVEEARS
jgi:hypothetical protein